MPPLPWQIARGAAPNAHVRIEKRIPVAAGLGGGSADAAAALRGLNALWELNLPGEELVSVAASLGSDVPFLLTGGAALGAGRGDRLQHLPAAETTRLLLVAPGGNKSPGKRRHSTAR